MKQIKLLMLAAMASLFVACSNDDVEYNSNDGVTVEFEQTTMQVRETENVFNVPIKVSGKRNGNIRLRITAAETGENPAVENVNYIITDKTLNLNTDTLENNTINVEIKAIDDSETNNDRTFTITIAEADGAEIGTANTATVTILNNDGFYEAMFGEWTFNAVEVNPETGSQVMKQYDMTISGPTDTTDPAYEQVLTATISGMEGTTTDVTVQLAYSFDVLEHGGMLGWVVGQDPVTVGSDGTPLNFLFNPGDGLYIGGTFNGTWMLGSNGEPTNEVSFGSTMLYLGAINFTTMMVDTKVAWGYITLTRK